MFASEVAATATLALHAGEGLVLADLPVRVGATLVRAARVCSQDKLAGVTSVVAVVVIALLSGVSFLYYGFKVLLQTSARQEFERYGMPAMRRLVGLLEILGGTAVVLGLAINWLGAFAAAGLTALMVLGLIVRFRIHDAPRLMVPAALLGALNAVLVVLFVTQ